MTSTDICAKCRRVEDEIDAEEASAAAVAAEQQEAAARELQQQRDEEVARRMQAAELARSAINRMPEEVRHPHMLVALMQKPTVAKMCQVRAASAAH